MCALFGFSVLPLSWAGLMLVLLGAALLVIDAHVVTHGALTLSGLVAIAIGLITLFHNAPAPYHTYAAGLIVTVTALLGGFWAFAISKAIACGARRCASARRRSSGWRASPAARARSSCGASSGARRSSEPLHPGDRIRVAALDGSDPRRAQDDA